MAVFLNMAVDIAWLNCACQAWLYLMHKDLLCGRTCRVISWSRLRRLVRHPGLGPFPWRLLAGPGLPRLRLLCSHGLRTELRRPSPQDSRPWRLRLVPRGRDRIAGQGAANKSE